MRLTSVARRAPPSDRHRFVLDFAAVVIEIRRPLEHITGVDQQRVWIFFANAFDECGATRDASLACVPVVRWKWIDLRVRVVGVQDCDDGLIARDSEGAWGWG